MINLINAIFMLQMYIKLIRIALSLFLNTMKRLRLRNTLIVTAFIVKYFIHFGYSNLISYFPT